MAKKQGNKGSGNIDAEARKLHDRWLRENDDFVRKCREKPGIYNCSRDFDRIVPWQQLHEGWKEYYRREARFAFIMKRDRLQPSGKRKG